MKLFGLLILFSTLLFAQPWNYDFGTGTGTHTTDVSLTFLPDPQTGGGTDARVRIGSGGGSFNLENQTISFGSQSYLRGVASTTASVNKFSIYDYTVGKSYTLRFTIRLGASDGSATGASSGTWYFFMGDGAMYSDNTNFAGAQVFTGIRWVFGASGSITTNVRVGSSWTASGISGTPFAQGNTYTVDIYGNNTTSTATYTYVSSQNVAANTMDIWVNGTLVADDIGKALLIDDSIIDSYMFSGENSTGNVANIFLDNIVYTNTIAANPLPVELSSFSAVVLENRVKLNWRTETEVNNYGFEILRAHTSTPLSVTDWDVLGFVEGYGNSNSPKEYSFIDENVTAGKYSYRLKQLDTDGQFEYSKVIEVNLGSPQKFELSQNYPNPFNPVTTIQFSLPKSGNVKLSIYNLLGEQVVELVSGFKEAGIHTINYNAENLNSGIYLYMLDTEKGTLMDKITLLR